MTEGGGGEVVLVAAHGRAVPTAVIVSAGGGWILATMSSANALDGRGRLTSVEASISSLVVVVAV